MTLQEQTTIRTKLGTGIASPADVAALETETRASRIAAAAERDRASTDLVTMADAQTAIDASVWGSWL